MSNKKEAREQKKPLKVISKFTIDGAKLARNPKRELVKNKKLKASSKQWIERHINDEFRAKAEALGYRARSAFKIIEINDKFDIFNLGRKYLQVKAPKVAKILDLGCAPGSWSQIILNKLKNIQIAGVDLLEIKPLEGLDFYKGDFCDEELQQILSTKYNKFDLIISDIAPNTTGQKSVDSLALISILEKEWLFVQNFLSDGGAFVCKVFMSGAEEKLLQDMKQKFTLIKHFKPKSSRQESNEFYVIALNFNKFYG
jgi:23S rRNA (uridine2552-2'-O)-methyltransferase